MNKYSGLESTRGRNCGIDILSLLKGDTTFPSHLFNLNVICRSCLLSTVWQYTEYAGSEYRLCAQVAFEIRHIIVQNIYGSLGCTRYFNIAMAFSVSKLWKTKMYIFCIYVTAHSIASNVSMCVCFLSWLMFLNIEIEVQEVVRQIRDLHVFMCMWLCMYLTFPVKYLMSLFRSYDCFLTSSFTLALSNKCVISLCNLVFVFDQYLKKKKVMPRVSYLP